MFSFTFITSFFLSLSHCLFLYCYWLVVFFSIQGFVKLFAVIHCQMKQLWKVVLQDTSMYNKIHYYCLDEVMKAIKNQILSGGKLKNSNCQGLTKMCVFVWVNSQDIIRCRTQPITPCSKVGGRSESVVCRRPNVYHSPDVAMER